MYGQRTPLSEETVNGLIDFANREEPNRLVDLARKTSSSLYEGVTKGKLMKPAYFFAGATIERLGSGREYTDAGHLLGGAIPPAIGGISLGTMLGCITGVVTLPLLDTDLAKDITLATFTAGIVVPIATNLASTGYEAVRMIKRSAGREPQ